MTALTPVDPVLKDPGVKVEPKPPVLKDPEVAKAEILSASDTLKEATKSPAWLLAQALLEIQPMLDAAIEALPEGTTMERRGIWETLDTIKGTLRTAIEVAQAAAAQ